MDRRNQSDARNCRPICCRPKEIRPDEARYGNDRLAESNRRDAARQRLRGAAPRGYFAGPSCGCRCPDLRHSNEA
jgi:hypothetical protein